MATITSYTQAQLDILLSGKANPAQISAAVAALTKSSVGLANVDNTADSAKPVSTAQAAAISAAINGLVNGAPGALDTLNELGAALGNDANFGTTITNALALKAPIASPAFTGTPTGITKAHVGLGNVDNTADTAKPVSTAQAAAIGAKLDALTTPVTLATSGPLTAGSWNLIDATSGPLTVTLPTPTKIGQRLIAERQDAGTNLISFAGTVRGLTSGLPTFPGVGVRGESIDFEAESLTSWRIIASHKPKALLDQQFAGLASPALTGTPTVNGKPVVTSTAQNMILDTDYATDPDDVAAVQIAINEHKRGRVNLLAVVVSSTPTSNQAAQGVQAHLKNQGLDATIPIGQWVGTNASVEGNSAFLATLRAEYPYTTAAGGFQNSVTTIRTALAAAANGSVNYACVGFLNNLAAVLASPADGISSMTGLQLFTAKVARVLLQGSSSTPATDTNWSSDKTATAYVLANCPVPMEWHRIDVGGGILIGRTLNPLPATTFARRALEAGTQAGIGNLLTVGLQSPDPMVVLSACYTTPEQAGLTRTNATVAWNSTTGIATFTNSGGATNYYVSKSTAVVPLLTTTLDAMLLPGGSEVAHGAAVTSALASYTPHAVGAGNSLWNGGNIETTPRFGLLDQSPASGELWLSFFTAPVTTMITKLGLQMGGTAAASNTLARIALFTVDAGENITKVAQIASDPTLGTANYFNPTRALATAGGFPAAYALQAGTRYALGFLFVGGTMPTVSGQNTGNGSTPPVLSRKITGQTDIAASYTVGSLSTDFRCMYLFGLAS